MKHLRQLVFLGLGIGIGSLLISCGAQPTEEATEAKAEVVANAEFEMDIAGMTCAMGCAKMIESKLAEMEGVSLADVDFEAKHCTVAYDDKIVSAEQLMELVNTVADGAYSATPTATGTEEVEEEVELEIVEESPEEEAS